MGSFHFSKAELAYAADNFERSPVAALAFAVANTGIANTPEYLGTLLDGPLDPFASIGLQLAHRDSLACMRVLRHAHL
jgi:hypothetical protein